MAVDLKDWALAAHLESGAASDGVACLAEKEAGAEQVILQHKFERSREEKGR